MGRIARKGFEYYRAETDRFRDIKIRKLRKEHSCAGYAIYQYVLNEIYRVEGCYIRFTQDELFDCAEYWNMREEEVLRIINYCTETGLFNAGIWKQYGILTGHSIQIRYVSMCHAAKRKTVIPEEKNPPSRFPGHSFLWKRRPFRSVDLWQSPLFPSRNLQKRPFL